MKLVLAGFAVLALTACAATTPSDPVAAAAEKCDTYATCVALLKQDKDINYEGASGSLDFNEWREYPTR